MISLRLIVLRLLANSGGIVLRVLTGLAKSLLGILYCVLGWDRRGRVPSIARWFIGIAVSCLPERERARWSAEWLAHLDDCCGALMKLRHAVGCVWAAQRIRATALWPVRGSPCSRSWSGLVSVSGVIRLAYPAAVVLMVFSGYLTFSGVMQITESWAFALIFTVALNVAMLSLVGGLSSKSTGTGAGLIRWRHAKWLIVLIGLLLCMVIAAFFSYQRLSSVLPSDALRVSHDNKVLRNLLVYTRPLATGNSERPADDAATLPYMEFPLEDPYRFRAFGECRNVTKYQSIRLDARDALLRHCRTNDQITFQPVHAKRQTPVAVSNLDMYHDKYEHGTVERLVAVHRSKLDVPKAGNARVQVPTWDETGSACWTRCDAWLLGMRLAFQRIIESIERIELTRLPEAAYVLGTDSISEAWLALFLTLFMTISMGKSLLAGRRIWRVPTCPV